MFQTDDSKAPSRFAVEVGAFEMASGGGQGIRNQISNLVAERTESQKDMVAAHSGAYQQHGQSGGGYQQMAPPSFVKDGVSIARQDLK